MRRWLTITGLLVLVLTATAQEMRIESFKKQKKGPFNLFHVAYDKQLATIDLKTGEKGFTFQADGKTDVQAEEGDGMLTLKAPHKTRFLVVKHPDYGQLIWKVPDKGLKKKKHYEAILLTFSPDKDYQQQNQWVVFDIQPKDAIVTVDSTMTLTRTGIMQMNLPIGSHGYKVEAPFHQTEEGIVELSDTGCVTVHVALQPFYSYLTVRTTLKGCRILIDGNWIGDTQATSGHLLEGSHRLTVLYDHQCYYEGVVSIGRAEKKQVVLSTTELYPRPGANVKEKETPKTGLHPVTTTTVEVQPVQAMEEPLKMVPVSIKAVDDSTEIWVDRELMGSGAWDGQLSAGYHMAHTRKNGLDSKATSLWIENGDQPVEIHLVAPMTAYGLLNVHCNEVGAEIYINDVKVGVTPLVIDHLPAGLSCRVKVSKPGFWSAQTDVKVIANDLVDVELKMKELK